MANIGHVIVFSFLGGVVSLIGGVILLSRRGIADNLAKYATPFAGGALLSAVFLDILKEGIELGDIDQLLIATLFGIMFFFLLEGMFQWFHHHHTHGGSVRHRNKWLIVIGDTMHNSLDGVAIAASFLISVPTGIVTTLAVATHEIPQEIGDFGLLLKKGMPKKQVLLVNFLSALATVLFAVLTFTLGSADKLQLSALLGLSAGFLLYVAMSDVIPSIHEEHSKERPFGLQAGLFLLGAVLVGVSIQLAHHFVG